MWRMRIGIGYVAPPSALRRDIPDAVRDELRGLGERWHEQTLPLHFETSAYTRYSQVYRRRSGQYNARKGHSRPMLYKGVLQRLALGQAVIRASRQQVRVRLSGLSHIPLGRGGDRTPDYVAELTATNWEETQRWAETFSQNLAARFENNRETATAGAV